MRRTSILRRVVPLTALVVAILAAAHGGAKINGAGGDSLHHAAVFPRAFFFLPVMHLAATTTSILSVSDWGMDHYSDFNMDTALKTMRENTPALISLVLTYLAMVYLLPQGINGKAYTTSFMFKHIKTVRQLWNIALALFSIFGTGHVLTFLAIQIYTTGLTESVCSTYQNYATGPVGFWMVAFLISKVFEFGDTLLLILSHGKRPAFLHWFHHATVLPFTWRTFVLQTSYGQWLAALNYTVHAVMYTYFALNDTFDDVRCVSLLYIDIYVVCRV